MALFLFFTAELNTFSVPQSTHFSYFVVVSLQGAILGFNENEKDKEDAR